MSKIIISLILFIGILLPTSYSQSDLSFEQADSLYRHYMAQSLYYDALDYAEAKVQILEAANVPKDSLYITALYKLGANYLNCAEIEKTETTLFRAKELCLKNLGKDNLCYATIMTNLGLLYKEIGDFEIAETYFKTAIDFYKTNFDRYEYSYTRALSNLAYVYDLLGDYEAAEPLYKETVERFKKILGEEDLLYINAVINIGVFYDVIQELETAESYYLEAQRLLVATGHERDLDYAHCIGNLGMLYTTTGAYDQSEVLLLESLSIFQKHYGPEAPECSSVLMGLGALYEELKRFKESEQYYLEALKIDGEYLGTDSYEYGVTLNNLAICYEEMHKREKALDAYLQVKKIFGEMLGKDHPNYGICLINLSSLHVDANDCEKAIVYATEAVSLFKETFGENHVNYLMATNALIDAYVKLKDYETAWSYAYHVIEANLRLENIDKTINEAWAKNILKMDYVSIHELKSTLNSIHTLVGVNLDAAGAKKQLILVNLVMELLTKKRMEFNGELDQLSILAQSGRWVGRGLRNTVTLRNEPNWKHYKENAFHFAETNKSVLLAGVIQTEKAYSFGDLPDSLVQKEQLLLDAYTEVKALLQEDLSEEELSNYRNELSTLAQEIDLFKAYIEENYPKYSSLKYSNTSASVASVQAVLDDKTALLEFVVGDSSVYLFYLDKKEIKLFETKVNYQTLQHKILLLHQALSSYKVLAKSPDKAYDHYVKNAYWFYNKLLKKPLAEAKGIEHLVIVTDRELGHLPFEAFLVERGGNEKNYQDLHYLIKDYSVSYDYSATLFVDGIKNKSKKNNSGRMLALAGDYSKHLDKNTGTVRLPIHEKIRKGLQVLPAAEAEVLALSKHFDGDFVFGHEANEAFFKQNAENYSIVHLAMHGILDRRSPILSSLVFTENSAPEENNFLQAYEISQMHLNAELVVLSACETGFGKFEQGNGIASLARSFMYAGVPSLVVTLWQVNDQSTAIIMQAFYEKLGKGMDKAEALRQAKLDYIQSAKSIAAHPAFWSPFIQLGNSEAIQVRAAGGLLGWWIGGASLLACLGMGLFLRKRRAA